MGYARTLTLGLLATAINAQVAPGFPATALPYSLNITFGTNTVSPPGELIPRPETASPPNITTPVFSSAGQGVLFLVDIDVPRNNTRVPLLHYLASGVTLGSDNKTLVLPSSPEAAYLQPSPPVGDIPHHYTFILFEQPSNFSVPAQYQSILQTRVGFDILGFLSASGLKQPALAANYFQVQNLTGTATQTFPPPRATNGTMPRASTTVTMFPGAAPGVVLGGGVAAWIGAGAALIAGAAAFAL